MSAPGTTAVKTLAELEPQIKWDANGLIPAVAQCNETGEILMLAWMSAAALRQTMATGTVTYWSRSRQELWAKGATSGHHQTLISAHLDCDLDALVLRVHQIGPACHLGTRSCFSTEIDRP